VGKLLNYFYETGKTAYNRTVTASPLLVAQLPPERYTKVAKGIV